MNDKYFQNFITTQYNFFKENLNGAYKRLYADFDHEDIRLLLSTVHIEIITSFENMNQRLPTNKEGGHFLAEDSRQLLDAIKSMKRLQKGLENTKYAFKLDAYYESVISKCSEFVQEYRGSPIPPYMDEIDIYYEIPIFIPVDAIKVHRPQAYDTYNLQPIGEGSYAKVYKYKDEFYDKYFVIKCALKNLTPKELERFTTEFESMKKLSSPYIVKVYRYNRDKHEYLMEYMDYSLYGYISKNNSNLKPQTRKSIGLQILKGIAYLSSKGIFHRDISPRNILIKKYDTTLVVKVSDFGLVKIPESNLTSANTDLKGSYNDPNLILEGFINYDFSHEIYALTRVLYFVITGREKIIMERIGCSKLKQFISIGMNSNKDERFKTINDISSTFSSLFES